MDHRAHVPSSTAACPARWFHAGVQVRKDLDKLVNMRRHLNATGRSHVDTSAPMRRLRSWLDTHPHIGPIGMQDLLNHRWPDVVAIAPGNKAGKAILQRILSHAQPADTAPPETPAHQRTAGTGGAGRI